VGFTTSSSTLRMNIMPLASGSKLCQVRNQQEAGDNVRSMVKGKVKFSLRLTN
jgi:hypothetical protein